MTTAQRSLAAGLAGIIYAVLYGFWTLLLTGGGHVNFIWIWLFVTVEFFGLYFPLMAVLAVNLRRLFAKIIFGVLIAFNLFFSTVAICDWIIHPGDDRPSDFSRTVQANGIESVILFAAIHFLPTIIFAVLLVISIVREGPQATDDGLNSLQLP